MNIISREEIERRWKELLKLIREEIAKGDGIGIGTGGGGTKPPINEEDEKEKAWKEFFDHNRITNAWKKSGLKVLDVEKLRKENEILKNFMTNHHKDILDIATGKSWKNIV